MGELKTESVHVYITIAEDESQILIDALNEAALGVAQRGNLALGRTYRHLRDVIRERLSIGRQA